MMHRTLVAMAAIWAAFSFPAQALTITNDYGGRIDQYLARWQRIARSGETVRIDGACNSACTLLLGTIPNERVCVTDRAMLGFHTAYRLDAAGRHVYSPEWTSVLLAHYPASVRSWLKAAGGLSPEMKILAGPELRRVFRACPPSSRRAGKSANQGRP